MKMIYKLLVLIAATAGTSAFAQDFAIIANSGASQSSISKNELKSILFGSKTSFGGSTAETCLWSAKEGDAFFSSVLGVSKSQFNQEWVKKELTGSGKAPKTRESVDDVISCVAGSRGGIGVIAKSAVGKAEGKVKVLDLTE